MLPRIGSGGSRWGSTFYRFVACETCRVTERRRGGLHRQEWTICLRCTRFLSGFGANCSRIIRAMSELLRDLYAHQAWADAEHWRAIAAHQPAADDRIIQERLRHIHVVQRAFLWATRARGGEFPITE